MTSSTATNWIELFPALANLDEDDAQCLAQAAQVVDLPTSQNVFHTGDACRSFLLVLDGVVRVQMCSEYGREVISRQLKEFERRNLLKISRGRITALDLAKLRALGEDSR